MTGEACHLMPFPSIYTNITIVLKNLDFCFFHSDNIIQKSTHNGSEILNLILDFSGVPVLKCHCILLVSNKIESFL